MATKASKKKPAVPTPNPQRDMFVIMPFSSTKSCTEEQWTDIFENVFSPGAEAAGLSCSRARVGTGSLIKSIIERLRNSYIVLADITDANPNVFYELGVRHSLSKRTIIVAQSASHIPSDLRGYWSLIYGIEPRQVKKFARDLEDIVEQINTEPERPDSPVGDYLDREFVHSSRLANLDIARKLSALQTELTGLVLEVTQPQVRILQHDCLSLFLDTRYIDPGVGMLGTAYELRDCLRRFAIDGTDEELQTLVVSLLEALIEHTNELRKSVGKGLYIQPEQLSLMKWSARSWIGQDNQPIKRAGSGIILVGHPGSGKSSLALSVAIANVPLERGRTGLTEHCENRNDVPADLSLEGDAKLRRPKHKK